MRVAILEDTIAQAITVAGWLEKAGFKVDVDTFTWGLFGNKVYAQSPDGGDEAPKGSTVTIKVR